MSENDIIAEYIKEHYPELLATFSFAAYKLGRRARELAENLIEPIAEFWVDSVLPVMENIPPNLEGIEYEKRGID